MSVLIGNRFSKLRLPGVKDLEALDDKPCSEFLPSGMCRGSVVLSSMPGAWGSDSKSQAVASEPEGPAS